MSQLTLRRVFSAFALGVAVVLLGSSVPLYEYAGPRKLVQGCAVLLAVAGLVLYLLRESTWALVLGATGLPLLGIPLYRRFSGEPAFDRLWLACLLASALGSLATLLYVSLFYADRNPEARLVP